MCALALDDATSRPVASRPPTGEEYLESLRDGREVWINGERVADVAAHPGFRNSARMVARLYDALHDPALQSRLVVPTDTGSGGGTHPFFRAAYTGEALERSMDAIAEWARLTYGWMGRSPDYKAAFLATLGSGAELYAPFEDNARRWYATSQERVLFFSHAIANPPVDKGRPLEESRDVVLHVERETAAGLLVTGAKVVATGSVLAQHVFVGTFGGLAPHQREFATVFCMPLATPGIKLLCRPSYEYAAAVVGSPFDYPLSSRLDENDAILVFDDVLVPWENVFCYGVEPANRFYHESGFFQRGMLQGCVRFAVKLDFLCGLLVKSLEMKGSLDNRGVQQHVGELVANRHLFWSLARAMVACPTRWQDGSLVPNAEAADAYAVLAGDVYAKIRGVFQNDLASALVYTSSNAADWEDDELRALLERFVRGAGGRPAGERVKVLKLAWDAIGSEFASRAELYERNYSGGHDQVRLNTYRAARRSGLTADFGALVESCMADYTTTGWCAPDLVDSDDVRSVGRKIVRSE